MSKFKRLLTYAKPYRFRIILAIVCAIVTSVGLIAATYYNGLAIDAIVGVGSVNFSALVYILVILGAIYAVASLFQWFISRYANQVSYLIVRDMRRDTFEHLNRQPLSYFDGHPHGDIVSRFTNDLDSISDALTVSITSFFTGVITIIAALAFMFAVDIKLTIAILVVTPLCIWVAASLTKFSQKTFKKQQQSVGALSSYISEIIGNQKTVKAFSREEIARTEFDALSDDLCTTATKAMFASALINPTTRFVNNIGYIVVGLAGGIFAVTQGVSVGIVSSFLIYSTQFAKPFNEMSGITTQLQTAFASLGRIFTMMDEIPETPDEPDAVDLNDCRGNVEIENVYFSYDPNRPLIQNFNFKATPGQMIAIVGPTGCGKTTLVNLLMRFYDVNSGTIKIDGIPVNKIKRDSLRRAFGMVLQDSWIFDGTVRENIAYGKPDASLDEVIDASKASYAHSFIKRFADGYDTVVSPDSLSQGQRQLITIARAMLASPKMLILDEATSSIDSLTEIRIQKAFLALMNGRTSFVIAHRLSTIVNADCILVMNHGNIIEQGTHSELLEQKGFYYDLYNSQFEKTDNRE